MADASSSSGPGELLPGWTPLTTRLLQSKNHSAWNYFDDPRGSVFSDALHAELFQTGMLQLRPAQTTTEAKYEAIRSILASSPVYRAVKESHEQRTTEEDDDDDGSAPPSVLLPKKDPNDRIRGDRSTFLDREYRSKPEFRTRHPLLASWIRSMERTAVHHLSSSSNKNADSNGTTMDLDLSQTSVQVAEYPGDGTSRYPAHLDSKNGNNKRLLTVIYYLTPSDWCATLDGGGLRVFHDGASTDIVPYGGRTVVFRSDAVQHAVLPSWRRPRRAITIWLYGTTSIEQPPPNVGIPKTIADTPDLLVGNERRNGPPPLDYDTTDATSSASATIFVSIAAYRDSETGPTLRDLFATAKFPDRIRVGLVLQVDTRPSPENEDATTILSQLPRQEPWWNDQVRVLQLDARWSTGPCNARAMAETLYRSEDYILQIDAHMRFRQNWDVFLIQQLHQCPQPQRSVLTAYPVGYQLPNEVPNETRGTLLVPWKFDANGMLRIKGRLFRQQRPRDDDDKPVLCHLYAAGFNFSRGPPPVPYDGTLHHLFFGEESSMAVRLFTAGYDTYAPSQSVVYHLWTRSHRPSTLAAQPDRRGAQHSRAVVQKQLLRGLGSPYTERTVDAFAQTIGVDFGSRTIAARGGRRADLLLDTAVDDDDDSVVAQKLGGVPSALIQGFLGSP